MSANSTARRAVKRVTHAVLGERGYGWLQAIAMARDIRSGAWTEPELQLIDHAVRPGELVVDAGANYGLWSWHLARAVGPNGRVVAYEPVPFTAATLRRVLKRLRIGNVEVRPVALGDAPGTVELRVPVQTSGAISAGQAHFAGRADERPGKELHVRWDGYRDVACPVVRLDDDLADAAVSFLKCDIEGAEVFAFGGATELIARSHPTVVLEINPWFLQGFGRTVGDLLDPFLTTGYELRQLDDAGRLVLVDPADVVEDNYVLVHPSRRERLASLLSG